MLAVRSAVAVSGREAAVGEGRGAGVSAEVAALVRRCRERLDPRQVPGLVAGVHRRPTGRVSQEQMAELVGVTPRWYGEFERGVIAGYSPAFVERAVYALRMSEAERKSLYYALGLEPPLTAAPPEVGSTLARTMEAAPWPVYLADETWNVAAANTPFAAWFPSLAYEPNVMRYVLTHPAARAQFVAWEHEWALPLLSRLRVAQRRLPDHEQLAGVVRDVLAGSAFAHRMWPTIASVELPERERDIRALYVPGDAEPLEVEILAFAPLRAPTWRLVHLVPAA